MIIYVPFADTELLTYAARLNEYRKGQGISEPRAVYTPGPGPVLGGVREDQILYLIAHGRESTNGEIAGMVPGRVYGKRQKNMSAATLAAQMKAEGLTTRFSDLRLLVCWAGLFRERGGKNQVPFAGQLCSALKNLGYTRIMVTGFNGSVVMQPSRNVVIEPGDVEGNQNSLQAALADQGRTSGTGGLVSTRDTGQSMAAIIAARDPRTLEHRSTWY